jgi:hypothetical protein
MDTQSTKDEISTRMVNGNPVKSYKKVVLGQLLLKTWDTMIGKETEIIFSGETNSDSAIFDVWSDWEKLYFERSNKRHFEKGMIIPWERKVELEEVRGFEQYTDSELGEIINSKFLALQSTLNKIQSVAVLFRMMSIAADLEKSDKITGVIQKRISELQTEEFAPKKPSLTIEE